MSELLTKWLAHYDPVHRGWTARGIANGLCATNGFAFPRIRGGVNLYRGLGDAANIDFSDPVGAGAADASEIRNFAWRGHTASQVYYYALTAIGGGGVETDAGENVRRFETDAVGLSRGALPNAPSNVTARAAAAGVFVVAWTYSFVDEEAAPSAFRVYKGEGGGPIDFETVVATVPFRRGRVFYRYVSDAFDDKARVAWAVRAITSAGVEDANVVRSEARADALGPMSSPSPIVATSGRLVSDAGEPTP